MTQPGKKPKQQDQRAEPPMPPTVLVRAGRTLQASMRSQGIDENELNSEMRIAGIVSLDQVAWAIPEPEGKISFIRNDGGEVQNSAEGDRLANHLPDDAWAPTEPGLALTIPLR